LPRDLPSLQALRDQLKRAIDAEQFELAAEIRDRLKEHE
jgi:protein-arginine kinase activator protein McsA